MEVPGYSILREIGRGGMSTVYLAVQESLDRQVALKVMSHGLAGNQAFRDRFLQEGRIVARFNHRNIVTIYDIGFLDDVYFIAMEYVLGSNLSERIPQGLTRRQCIYIVKRIARALSHAHDRGFIHRDIKPSNILFRDDRDAVLADFGIAKSLQEASGLTMTGLTPGTPNYMSPEQLRGRSLDGRSDLYSLGVVFYEMLTQDRPFEADTGIAIALRHINEPPPELPDEFDSLRPVMSRLLAKETSERFSNAAELIKALDHSTADRPVVTAPDADKTVVAPDPPPFTARRTRLGNARPMTAEPTQRRSERAPSIFPKGADTQFEQPASEEVPVTLPSVQGRRISRKGLLQWTMAGATAAIAAYVVIAPLLVDYGRPTVQEQLKIERLLASANLQLEAEQVFKPQGDNAYQTYQEVLAIDSDHPRALKGMTRIAAEMRQDAREEFAAGKLNPSLALIDRGLTAKPDDEGLLALRNEVRRALDQRRQQQRIDTLLAQAGQNLEQGRLTEPKGDNAYEAFKAVLAIAPRSNEALAGLDRVATGLEDQARVRQSEGELYRSLALIDEGLTVSPEQEGLIDLREEIRVQISAERARQRLADNLDRANDLLQADRLIQPRGDNAWQTYKNVLSEYPDDARARAGMEEVAQRLEERVRAQLNSSQHGQALAKTDQALELFPNHPEFAALRLEIVSAQARIRRDAQIAALIDKAEQQLANGKYLAPRGDSALASYRDIRALDPANTNIEQGLRTIATHFLTQGRQALDAGQARQALAAISNGLEAAPGDRPLLDLRARIHRQQAQAIGQQRRLATLLTKAEAQLADGSLTGPQGDNALETYQKVLKIDPENKVALGGIAGIPDLIYQKAQRKYEAEALEGSLALVGQGLQLDPQHKGLATLKIKIMQRARANVEVQRVAQLLDQAQQQLVAVQLTTPPGDNALDSYQEVLSLDANNQQAKAGLREIANRYTQLAQTKRAAGDLEGGLSMAVRGLTVQPKHPQLLSLRNRINQQLAEKAARERTVSQLLAEAQQRLEAGRLTEPQRDSAYDAFQKVLEVDPENQRAQRGVEVIATQMRANRYLARAISKREDGDQKGVLRMARLGLDVDPTHAGLANLRSEIESVLQAGAERKRQLEQREQMLEKLLAQAQRQIDEQKLSEPSGDNAYQTIQTIWRIEPGNARAQQALDRLMIEYGSLARQYRRDGELQQSIAIVDKALAIEPENADLLALQKSLKVEIAEAEAEPRAPFPVVTQDRPETVETPAPKPEEEDDPIIGTF